MKFASNCNTTYSQQIGSRIADVRIPLPLPFATPLSRLPLPLLYTSHNVHYVTHLPLMSSLSNRRYLNVRSAGKS